jgi:hypothetical protein
VDILLNTATNVETFYLNGSLVATSGVLSTNYLTGSGAIKEVAFGDDTSPLGTVSNFSLTAQSVPEPASCAILLVAGGLAMKRRRRSSNK